MGEESHEQDSAASYSWWLDSQTSQPHHQSQWLKATLSDLDEKILTMVNLTEGGGDTFAKRAEMYYNSRPQFIKMVQDLHKSYRSVAEKYDQLCYESLCGSYKNLQTMKTKSLENSKLEASVLDSEYEILNNKQENDVETLVDECELEGDDNKWSEISLQISELIDKNKIQTEELIKRNEEKKREIKVLCERKVKLMEENKILEDKLAQCKADMNQNGSHLSKLKRMILGK